jgi:predicted DsbA family dithiol-disulfide isomerase
MISLDIYADPVCPWCAIGKAELDRALAANPGHPFEIRWLPFQLNPDLPPEGVDRQSFFDAKFGGPEAVAAAFGRVTAAAARAGIDLDPSRATRQPNTRDAHRLILWAEIENRQGDVIEALMRAHFRDGRDIGSRKTLIEIATEVGLDSRIMGRLLEGESDRETVAAIEAEARMAGIEGVPSFVIGGTHVVVGAQPSETWQRIIDDVVQNWDISG